MSLHEPAAFAPPPDAAVCRASPAPVRAARVALLGVGRVGRAVLARLAHAPDASQLSRLRLVHVADSKASLHAACGIDPCAAALRDPALLAGRSRPSRLADVRRALQGSDDSIVIDATASGEVADWHAHWLDEGIHVVTACKVARGTSQARWQAVEQARNRTGATYGDSATVGAGLPLLRTIRELRSGGERIHAIVGVLSGSLGWLFERYNGDCRFSDLLLQARAAGFTEPDPRDDLSGEDVQRKLLILARAAGLVLEPQAVTTRSLVPDSLGDCAVRVFQQAVGLLDEAMLDRLAAARARSEVLRFVARIDAEGARVGLESLPAAHALAGGAGTDNRVAIWSDRYRDRPLMIQGPGAGADLTAAALIDDALRATRARS